MKPSDAKAKQLREVIREIVQQFRCMDVAVANQPLGDLSIPEIHIIEFLGDRKSCMMRELAEFLLVAVNTVTSMIDKLETKAFVRRERDEADRRIVMVKLTDKGREACRGIMETRLNACRTMLTPLNEDEQEIFLVLTRKIARGGAAAHR